MANLPQIGVEAIFVTKLFEAGAKVYNEGLKQAEKATDTATGAMSQKGASMGGAVGTAMGIAGSAISTFAAVAVAGLTAAGAAVVAFTAITAKLAAEAAPVENIEFAFNRLAGSVGLSLSTLEQATKGTIEGHILMMETNKALLGSGSQLANQLGKDLPQVWAIAATAAKAFGGSTVEMYDRIINSVKRATPRSLVELGIKVDKTIAEKEYADSIGTTAEKLNEEGQQLAILAAVMKNADSYMKLFEGSQEAATTKMSRGKALFAEIGETIGQYFIPALKTTLDAGNKLLQWFLSAISEGGALYPIMIALGAAADMAAEGFANFVDVMINTFSPMLDGIGRNITDIIDSMFSWGVDLVVEFARGMIEGATQALTAAINIISGILNFFFSPGSPPQVAPDIDTWGAATMNEWLNGFSQANFDILKNLQSPLKSALDIMAKTGKIGKDAAGSVWADISEAMISGLGSGDLSGAFSKITASAGQFGSDLIKLVKLNVQLAKATDAVTLAEKRLADSRKREEVLNTKLQLQLMEYNDLARMGASPEVLAAKLAGINATEDSLIAQQSETKAAEEGIDSAKEQLAIMKQQFDLQKQLIDQMLEITKARIPETKTPAAGGAGLGAGALSGEGMGGLDFSGLGTTVQGSISTAIENAKALIKQKLQEMWGELVGSIQEGLAGPLEAFRLKWEELKAVVQPVFAWINEQVLWFSAQWAQFWTDHGENIKFIWNEFWKVVKEDVVWTWEEIKRILSEAWDWLSNTLGIKSIDWKTLFTDFWNFIKSGFKMTLDIIGGFVDIFALAIQGKWDVLWTRLKDTFAIQTAELGKIWENVKRTIFTPIENAFNGISSGAQRVIDKIGEMINKLKDIKVPKIFNPGSPTPFEIGLLGISDAMEKIARQSIPELKYGLSNASLAPAMAAQSVSTNNYRTANVNMGGVNINGSMGAAEFEATIRRILKSEFAS